MKFYIRAATSISPQNTFKQVDFLTEVVEYQQNRLTAIEPDYKAYIDPKVARRMSRMIKMGVSAAQECLNEAGIEMPGAIITGTALGCQEDTVQFLTRLIEFKEDLLPPTPFIQSTHNTVAAQIALMLRCHNYNNTFVHKSISFESALLDGMMLLNEQETDNVLVGGMEEMTDTGFTILTRLGLYKRWPVSNLSLIKKPSKGTVGGEGAAFFVLANEPRNGSRVILKGLTSFYKPAHLEDAVKSFLVAQELEIGDVDLILTGKNGDLRNDSFYLQLERGLFEHNLTASYKHLCGDYPTSSAFALWLAFKVIETERVPDVMLDHGKPPVPPRNILIYNHYFNTYHSLLLISAA
jgi:hypothetical protein